MKSYLQNQEVDTLNSTKREKQNQKYKKYSNNIQHTKKKKVERL